MLFAVVAAVLATAATALAAAGGTASGTLPAASTTTNAATSLSGGTSPSASKSKSKSKGKGKNKNKGNSAPPPGAAPVTGHVTSLVYHGPVYEKTAAGEIVPYTPPPPVGQVAGSGGIPVVANANAKPQLLVPGATAHVVENGLAAAPMSAPAAVQQIVWAGNEIVGLPYIYGGGHASFVSPGYDCSGTVSFALHGASLLSTPMDSSEFMGWGGGGIGRWVTIFTNPGHAYMTVAGLRLDTSAVDDPSNQQGPRWRPLRPGNPGFTVRHPSGL